MQALWRITPPIKRFIDLWNTNLGCEFIPPYRLIEHKKKVPIEHDKKDALLLWI